MLNLNSNKNWSCISDRLYYAFGSAITDMQYVNDTNKSYRYGFNGEEKENIIDGDGMVYDLGERFYDGRLGRMFSADPLESNYPWQSTYAYCDNNPIAIIDIKGMGDGNVPTSKEITKPNGEIVTIGGTIEQTDDKLVLINNPNRPDKGGANDWDYAEWDPTQQKYVDKKFECQDVGTVSSVPQYQYGELYETDLGQKTIWPVGSHPTEGFKYIGTGYYSLNDKVSVIDLKDAHPDLYHLWLPKTKNALMFDQAFKDGGRDAGIFFVGSISSVYIIAYGSIYASIAYSTLLRTATVEGLKQLGFRELQALIRSYSGELNAFFKSGGSKMASKEALQAYKELATRILNGTGGAPGSKITETALRVQQKRLEMINKALKAIK